ATHRHGEGQNNCEQVTHKLVELPRSNPHFSMCHTPSLSPVKDSPVSRGVNECQLPFGDFPINESCVTVGAAEIQANEVAGDGRVLATGCASVPGAYENTAVIAELPDGSVVGLMPPADQ